MKSYDHQNHVFYIRASPYKTADNTKSGYGQCCYFGLKKHKNFKSESLKTHSKSQSGLI